MCYLTLFCINKHTFEHLNHHFWENKLVLIHLFCNFALPTIGTILMLV